MATTTCCVGDNTGGHHPFCENQPRGIRVRGVIARNGLGELAFFSDSRAEGVPVPGLDHSARGPIGLEPFAAAVAAAEERRVSYDDLAAIDPPAVVHSCDAELRADRAYDPFRCKPTEWTCSCGKRFVHVCDEAEGCFFEAVAA